MTKYYYGDFPSNVGPRKEMDLHTSPLIYLVTHCICESGWPLPRFPVCHPARCCRPDGVKPSVISANLKIAFP